jgi:hypothetical protein
MPIVDEIDLADLIHLNRWKAGPALGGSVQAFPALFEARIPR